MADPLGGGLVILIREREREKLGNRNRICHNLYKKNKHLQLRNNGRGPGIK